MWEECLRARSGAERTLKTKSGWANRRPRIGIDMHVADGKFQGSRTHCLELFSRVAAITPECDFVLLAAEPHKLSSFSAGFASPNVSLYPMPHKPSPVRLLRQLPQIAQRCDLSLLHVQYIAPPFPHCATAVTVHDILFESHPEYFEKFFVMRSRLLVPMSVRKSAAVFTVSEFSRKHICETYSVPAEKIHTIPNGVNCERFFPGQDGAIAAERLGLQRGEYFLTVGRLEPRKNHVTLLRAWARLKPPRPRLLIVGQRDFQFREAIDLIHTLKLEDDVVVSEGVSDADLPSIYRYARAFIYCSWAEGFGMPLLEAMASGVPVISAANTALTEVCANASLSIDPGNPDEIAAAVVALDRKPELRESLVGCGLQRVKEFTWERSAETVRSVYLRTFGLEEDAPIERGVAKAPDWAG